jgi:hypothetical protein
MSPFLLGLESSQRILGTQVSSQRFNVQKVTVHIDFGCRVMGTRRTTCPNCERLARRVAELERLLAEALARIAELEKQLAAARKDSSTSSKPPSSDLVKPPQPAVAAARGRKRKRRLGGQPGHPRHERAPFPPEEVRRARAT